MKKFDVQIALEGIREAKDKWREAKAEFDAAVAHSMRRLIHEAAANYMSDREVAQHSGLHIKQVRTHMSLAGLDPRNGKTLLAGKASKVLSENAELLGIQPHEMDLTSPLAYLPMGSAMRQRLQDASVSKVTEVDWDESGEGFLETLTGEIRRWFDYADESPFGVETDSPLPRDLAKHLLSVGWHK